MLRNHVVDCARIELAIIGLRARAFSIVGSNPDEPRRNRTSNRQIKSLLLYRLSYGPSNKMAARMGFEPMISCVTGKRPLQTGPTRREESGRRDLNP